MSGCKKEEHSDAVQYLADEVDVVEDCQACQSAIEDVGHFFRKKNWNCDSVRKNAR
jgi:hypothetical protein